MKTPNFSQMIFDISSKAKLKDCQIAAKLGVGANTLAGWKNHGFEPRYSRGAALIELHAKTCKQI